MKKSHLIELILFIALLSVFTFFGVKIFKHTFDIGTTYHLEFQDIDSISIGSPVRILGVDIGHVTKIQTAYDKIYVDFIVNDSNIKFPEGTVATIEFFGIAGSRSIELSPPKKGSKADGIIVKNPIRIGDAFGIIAKFLKATMVSIGGMYEFAKDRTQGEAEVLTHNFLDNTNAADDSIINLTSKISKGGATLHKNLNNTETGMTRLYNETKVFNLGENYNYARHGVRLTKRAMLKLHRDIKDFNYNYLCNSAKINAACEKLKDVEEKKKAIEEVYDAFKAADNALTGLDKNLSQENIDKVYQSMENIKIKSEQLNNKF